MPKPDRGERDDWRSAGSPSKGSFFGNLWRGTKWFAASPFEAFPKKEILENGKLIAFLAAAGKAGARGNGRFRVNADRSFDLAATAFLHGILVPELEAVLRGRQKATARAAYLAFALGWAFFLAWLLRAALVPWTADSVVQALEFLPFCLFFFLIAFKSALENYQIRTRRLATPMEYLQTEGTFWPR
jgi:hypothetical protein